MQQRGSSGREYTGDAERDERAVEADDEAVVAVDAIHQRFAQAAQRDQFEQILRRYGYIGDLARYRGASRYRYAGVGLRQRRRVVHAVAYHYDLASGGLLTADIRGLVLRKHFGEHLVHPDFRGHGFGGSAA